MPIIGTKVWSRSADKVVSAESCDTPPRESPMARVRRRKSEIAAADAHRVVALGAELRIGNANALQAMLCEALESGDEIILDATDMRSADSAGLQLLYAFVRDSKARGISVSWQMSETILRRDAGLLGLDKALGLKDTH
ncbi:MAG: STAS domain-containing protein [Xanthomonadaceae bacterium]|nr:STAS domain-containing protein [Xanthomonadaceae bacterium]MDP2185540.1 STAS domain-containing protein [Xanthomonadales bacterium]MDZ4115229.1 STAS domain-containing protein [Xanthomonadaceae bacterium]MDZ4377592.1 STAS domain-containing protein [Xanthomonadaceae bacterium]